MCAEQCKSCCLRALLLHLASVSMYVLQWTASDAEAWDGQRTVCCRGWRGGKGCCRDNAKCAAEGFVGCRV